MVELGKVLFVTGSLGIGIAAAAVSSEVANVVERIYENINGQVQLRKLRRVEQQRTDPIKYLKGLKEQALKQRETIQVFTIAMTLGLFGLWIAPMFKSLGFAGGTSLGFLLYSWYIRQHEKGVRLKKLTEAVLIYDAMNVYIPTGRNLTQTLESILPSLKVLRQPIEKFLNRYPSDPKQAKLLLEQDLNFDEAGLLVNVMLQVASTGRLEVTSSEAVRLEDIRKSMHQTSQAMRPTYIQLVNLLPLLCGASLVIYIVGKHALDTIKALNSTNMMN
ncbi:hypothetical protein Dred_0827 [Desulforamulus reducens MI-1]|uniref:Uncharacterized protein n=1 Tax=Desulforamulus reducens (strain ATCC BAA-1160 / DSM 100696 / MI-1) TaxID=349161 RepID=A4J2R2_DESRM|nr:hypothetical protein [Desulforamulus reducens]ABO49365.1 hypothetical protein Dred_0827 [Desulforamulus reducens MI-1]